MKWRLPLYIRRFSVRAPIEKNLSGPYRNERNSLLQRETYGYHLRILSLRCEHKRRLSIVVCILDIDSPLEQSLKTATTLRNPWYGSGRTHFHHFCALTNQCVEKWRPSPRVLRLGVCTSFEENLPKVLPMDTDSLASRNALSPFRSP